MILQTNTKVSEKEILALLEIVAPEIRSPESKEQFLAIADRYGKGEEYRKYLKGDQRAVTSIIDIVEKKPVLLSHYVVTCPCCNNQIAISEYRIEPITLEDAQKYSQAKLAEDEAKRKAERKAKKSSYRKKTGKIEKTHYNPHTIFSFVFPVILKSPRSSRNQRYRHTQRIPTLL
jgi:hypothetical protein